MPRSRAACGPYKLSVHSGSDKFALYPIIGRVCGDLLHVKTAGTSYLEALRVAARQNAPLFREIAEFALTRFETDRATYHISADLRRVPKPADLSETARETAFLDENDGRQVSACDLRLRFGRPAESVQGQAHGDASCACGAACVSPGGASGASYRRLAGGMKTIILERPGRFSAAETPAPTRPQSGNALVKVRSVGICGTDLHAYRGRQPFFRLPAHSGA